MHHRNRITICLYLILVIVLKGCTETKSDKKADNQIKIVNPPPLKIAYPNDVPVGKEVCVRFFFDNEFKIASAYVDCPKDSIKAVDYRNGEIKGCNTNLYVMNDTVLICTTPLNVGKLRFDDLKILYYDLDSNFFIADTSITIMVGKLLE